MTSRVVRRPILSAAVVAVAVFAGPAGIARAQAAPATGRPVTVTRADLATAYLAFDKALTEHPPSAAQAGGISTAFDQATLAFFAGRNADAVRAIYGVTERLIQPGGGAASRLALRATVEPHVVRRGAAVTPILRIVPLYASLDSATPAVARTFEVRILSDGGRVVATQSVTVSADALPGAPIDYPLAALTKDVPRGRYRVIIAGTLADALAPSAFPSSEWFVSDDDLDAKREELVRRAATLDTMLPEALLDAVTSFKSRVRVLTTRPSPLNITQWRTNPLALAHDLELEFQQLVTGIDPYAHRSGSLWRVLRTPSRSIPLRTYVPVAVARDRKPAPLLIAIHGVGGDEHMFPDALGGGLLLQLAEQYGIVVASPNGDQFTTPDDFDRLVAQMSAQVPIDPERIWIVGHSRGAGQALALAQSRASVVAAVACLAGFGRVPPDTHMAPAWVALGELDPLAAPARLSPMVAAAQAASMGIELTVWPQAGHTTVVGRALPDAVRWLRARTLQPAVPERR